MLLLIKNEELKTKFILYIGLYTKKKAPQE